jgi:hypothetical protein
VRQDLRLAGFRAGPGARPARARSRRRATSSGVPAARMCPPSGPPPLTIAPAGYAEASTTVRSVLLCCQTRNAWSGSYCQLSQGFPGVCISGRMSADTRLSGHDPDMTLTPQTGRLTTLRLRIATLAGLA